MLLYGSSMSPFVRKVLAFAAEKDIALDNRPTGIGETDPEFRAASPFGKIPALRDPGADFAISDSSAIIAYLDAVRPEPNLIPAAPAARARCIWFEEFADTLVMDAGRAMFFNRVVAPLFLGREGDAATADRAEREQLPRLLDYLETVVPAAGGFLIEDRITLADIAVASPFVNLTRHLGIAMTGHPRTRAYVDAILARDSFTPWIEKEERVIARARAAAGGPAGEPAQAPTLSAATAPTAA